MATKWRAVCIGGPLHGHTITDGHPTMELVFKSNGAVHLTGIYTFDNLVTGDDTSHSIWNWQGWK